MNSRRFYARPPQQAAYREQALVAELVPQPEAIEQSRVGPEAEADLLAFLKEHVVDSMHIYDVDGTMKAWTETWRADVREHLSPDVMGDWMTLFAYLQIMNYFPVDSLRNMIASNYPRALAAPHLCCMPQCRSRRPFSHVPACDAHMCELCRSIAVEGGWTGKYRIVRNQVGVHLMTREPDRAARLAIELRRSCYVQMQDWCPGVLRVCAAEREKGAGYLQSEQCTRDVLLTPIVAKEAHLVPELCQWCWDINECLAWKWEDHQKRDYRATGHLLDPTDPLRRKARACADPQCNVRLDCALCRKVRFLPTQGKDKTRNWKLCKECLSKGIACMQCRRVAANDKFGFFALRWILGASDALGRDPRMARYCVRCFPTISKPLGNKKGECYTEKRRALCLLWRFSRRRELHWMMEFVSEHPDDWAKQLFAQHMTARERYLIEEYVPGGWQGAQRDERTWDCLYMLMMRLAWVQRDVFLLIFRRL